MNNLTPILAAVCRIYGKRVDGGGYEICIPSNIVSNLPPTAQIQFHDDVTRQGVRICYLPNITIEGRVIDSASNNSEVSLLLREEEKAGS